MSQHSYRCPMRWGDMDAQGHISDAIYLDYLQEARVDFLLSGPEVMGELLRTGVLVVSHQVEYLAPVAFSFEPMEIRLWVDSVGAAKFTIGYQVFSGGNIVVRARTVAVPFDLASNKLRRLSPAEREVLVPAVQAAEQLRPLSRVRWSESEKDQVFSFCVRWSDIDSYNHVNNVKYYDYVQEARIQLIQDVWGSTADGAAVVVRQDVDYLLPMDFRQRPYEVHTVVAAVGRSSFTLAAEIRDPLNSQVYAAAGTVIVAIDPDTGRSEPLSDELRARLAPGGGEGAHH